MNFRNATNVSRHHHVKWTLSVPHSVLSYLSRTLTLTLFPSGRINVIGRRYGSILRTELERGCTIYRVFICLLGGPQSTMNNTNGHCVIATNFLVRSLTIDHQLRITITCGESQGHLFCHPSGTPVKCTQMRLPPYTKVCNCYQNAHFLGSFNGLRNINVLVIPT